MALVAIAAAKGSPGVTTTALLVGGLWPRPVIVAECDPSGGDVAYRMPGADGRPLDPQVGLLSLGAAGRKTLHPELVFDHTQQIVGGLDVLAGVAVPEQAGGLANQWAQLGPVMNDLENCDVVADLGRVGATTPQNSMLVSAHAVVMVVGIRPSNVIHLRERLSVISAAIGGPVGPPVHIVVVAPPKRTKAVGELRDAVARTEVPVAKVHHLAYDERGADVFHGQVVGRPNRTALVRSAIPIVQDLADTVAPFFRAVEPSPEVSA